MVVVVYLGWEGDDIYFQNVQFDLYRSLVGVR